MAKDDIRHTASGSELKVESQHENAVDGSTLEPSKQEASRECTAKRIGSDKVQLRTLMFSRSAETVGHLGGDQKQAGQRPDRLHARRSSAGRRSGAAELNGSGLRYTSSKSAPRNIKSNNIRSSKSCTKECEIVRDNYTNYNSPGFSTFYDDILRAADESDTFTAIGEDAEGFDPEDVTLTESTDLVIDNGELEAKSDITITSCEDGSCSPGGSDVVQNITDGCDNGNERPGACRYGPKIDTSKESLDFDESDGQLNGCAAVDVRKRPQRFGSWIEEDYIRALKMLPDEDPDVKFSSPKQSNNPPQINTDNAELVMSQFSLESTRIQESPLCLQQFSATEKTFKVSKDLLPSCSQADHNVTSANEEDVEEVRRNSSQVSTTSYLTHAALEEAQARATSSLSKHEMFAVMNELDTHMLSRCSSRLSLPRNKTTPLSLNMSEQKHGVQNIHQARPKSCIEKRTPYPEELSKAVTEAFNSGQFHTSQMVSGNNGMRECLHDDSQSNKDNIDEYAQRVDKMQVTNFSEHAQEKFTFSSPVISILSFSLVKEISDSAMPRRRDHNDVILGEIPNLSSRPCTPLSPTPELHTFRQTAQNSGSSNLSQNSPQRASNAKALDSSSTCKVANENDKIRGSLCTHTRIEAYPQISHEYTSQKTNLTNESTQRKVDCSEMGDTEDSCNTRTNKEAGGKQSLTTRETTRVTPERVKAEGPLIDSVPRSVYDSVPRSAAKGLIKSSVLALGSHEYLPFLNKLRQEKTVKKEPNRQHKTSKSQRKVDNTKKSTVSHEDDCHGDEESLGSTTPQCPVGREVPADWKPGAHASHPLTKLSTIYTSSRKVRRRRSVRKKKRVSSRPSPRRKDKEVFGVELNKHASNCEVNVSSPVNPLETSRSCSVIEAHEAGSTDTDANPEDEVLASFEYKRRYYERLSKLGKDDSGGESKGEHSPNPKRVTSQVRLLKTLDELYSSDSSGEGEAELPYTNQPLFDVGHQASLFNYYTTRLKHMTVLSSLAHQQSVSTRMPYIRIRKVEQEVPSALDHKRLKSLYECRMKKPTLTSKIRKVENTEQTRSRCSDKTDGVTRSGKPPLSAKGYRRSLHNLPKIANNKATSHDSTTDIEESEKARFRERIFSPDKAKTTYDAKSVSLPHRSYLDILKSNIHNPSQHTKVATAVYNAQASNSNTPKQNTPDAGVTFSKESAKFYTEEHDRKTPPLKERESVNRNRMKVRFADPCNEHKERVPYEMSDEDTWCSSVNAMLLRANRVMDDVTRNDHRYPKPDSARVVSPVPPKSPTFLKELLKQDTIERKQAKGNTRATLERRYKEPAVKQEKIIARSGKPTIPLAMFTAPGTSFLAIDQRADTAFTQNNSSLVYSVPIKDGSEPPSINEKSAGVLKISIQMSKRAQERAWLTHERIKRQRATNTDYDLKTEIKSIPKKLTPLRISKPVNFQNPDSRNFERIPMRDVLSKTLMGQSTSSQQIFQPKTVAAESLATSRSNFLLDQHSETFRYFRGPYMHQRSSSIVPLFSDSNNNAFLRGISEEETSDGGSQDDKERPRHHPSFTPDVITIPQMDAIIPKSESDDGGCCVDEDFFPRYSEDHPEYCYNEYGGETSEPSTEKEVKYNRAGKIPTSVKGFKTGANSKRCHRLDDRADNLIKSYPDDSRHNNKHNSVMSSPSTDTPLSFSSNKNTPATTKPAETKAETITYSPATTKTAETKAETITYSPATTKTAETKAETITYSPATTKPAETKAETITYSTEMSTETSKSRKVYISGMSCFDFVDRVGNLEKAREYIAETDKLNMGNEQREDTEAQSDPQETLLDALLGYEIGRMSKRSVRTAEVDSQQKQTLEENDISKPRVSAYGVSELWSTCYLNQWAPNYLESALDTDKSPTSAITETDRSGYSKRSDQESDEELPHHACAQTSNDADTATLTYHHIEIPGEKELLDMDDEAAPECTSELPNPQSAPKSKPHVRRDDSPTFDNLTVLGSTIALVEKRSQHVSTSFPAIFRPILENHSQKCSRSSAREISVDKPVNQAAIPRPTQDLNYMNRYIGKLPADDSRHTKIIHAAQRQAKILDSLTRNSTKESTTADSVTDIGNDDLSMNKTSSGHFDWTKVKIPPSFIKGVITPSAPTVTEKIPSMDHPSFSPRSIYSNSSAAPCTQAENADVLDTKKVSKTVHTSNFREEITPNFLDSIRDPPNSLCTTINMKDVTSSACTHDAEIDNLKQAAASGRDDHYQNNRQDTADGCLNPVTTKTVCKNLGARSGTSHVEGRALTLSRMSGSCMSPGEMNTTSQISDSFDEDEDETVAPKEPTDDASEWKSESVSAPVKDADPSSQHSEWHHLQENVKPRNADFTQRVNVQPRTTLRSSLEFLDRDFLRSLRNTDLLHTVSTDRHRLFKSLQRMTRRKGYLPMFQVKSRQVIEMMPQIVVLNHCAKTFIERGSSSFSGTVRCLPVFYTEDDHGFITSIYTVNWIPEGVYSLEKSPIETITSGEMKANTDQQASFGKLLQYSPFASDQAFTNQQAYLIGDEVSSREEAAKTLTVAHDEAEGDLAKYFMLMCGWVPPLLNSVATLPTSETALEVSSVKAESKERDSNMKHQTELAQNRARELLHELDPVAEGRYLEKKSKITEDKASSLPQIATAQTVATSNTPSGVFESRMNEVCTLPAICYGAGSTTTDKVQPTLMLCLRCGVRVKCAQAQTEDVIQTRDSLPFEKWQTQRAGPMNIKIKALQGRNSPSCYRQRSCQHSWEVSEVGLALPLITAVTRRVHTRRGSANDRISPLSSRARSRSKLSLKRATKSQTEFECKKEYNSAPSTLPQVRSQPDIYRERYNLRSIDILAEPIIHTEENPQRNRESAGRGFIATSTKQGPTIKTPEIDADKEINVFVESVKSESRAVDNRRKTPTHVNDLIQRHAQKSPATAQKLSTSPHNQRLLSQQAASTYPTSVKYLVSLRQQASVKQNQKLKETTQQAAPTTDRDKLRETDPSVAGWTWKTVREVLDEEQDLMEKRTWSQAVIPPPFPAANPAHSALNKQSQKPTSRAFQSRKKQLAQHRRNLSQIHHSYVSPYYAKKEVKRARSRTPASDSGDDRSSISRITTNSGLSSSSSESNTEEESSTEESECGSRSSDSGSDFFTRYANKGGPTSVDDIFKRTLPRQRLDFKLARLKEAKEKEEIEQLGYLRGKEGATPPPQDHGDNARGKDHAVSFALSEYDMCSDAEEIRQLWKECFPEVDFWDRKRRKKFKKTKILS